MKYPNHNQIYELTQTGTDRKYRQETASTVPKPEVGLKSASFEVILKISNFIAKLNSNLMFFKIS